MRISRILFREIRILFFPGNEFLFSREWILVISGVDPCRVWNLFSFLYVKTWKCRARPENKNKLYFSKILSIMYA